MQKSTLSNVRECLDINTEARFKLICKVMIYTE